MKLTKNRARKPLVETSACSRGWSQPANEPKTFNIGVRNLGGDGASYKLHMSRNEAETIRDWLIKELAKPE